LIPDVSREVLLEAMEEFDKALRDTEEWSGWEQKGTYKYAIVHDDKHYPVKQLISMATGEPKANFSGGFEANSYVSKRGLSVVALQNGTPEAEGVSIRDGLEEILAHYASARANEPFGGNELRSAFKRVSDGIAASAAVSRRPTLIVKPSMGKGNWAAVPWISLLDTRETDTTQRGVYCVYLLRQDMSGVYLTFNQGVTEPKNRLGKVGAHEFLRQNAADLRGLCGSLLEHGFRLDDKIDLRADSAGLGSDYESSTIAYKFYEGGAVPSDEDLLEDLEAVLRVYDRYLADDNWREAVELCRPMLSDRAVFDEEEIEHKLKIVQQIREALHFAGDADGFVQLLRKAFVNSHNNLTNWQAHDSFTKWAIDNPERVREAVGALLDADKSLESRIDQFLDDIPKEAVSGLGTQISIASFLLMGWDPVSYPFYKPTPFEKVERVLGWPRTLETESAGAVYAHHREFAQRLLDKLRKAGLGARDLLDAQSLIWILASSDDPRIRAWRGEAVDSEKSLGTVLSWIGNLRTQPSPDGLIHYKPLLLLSVLEILDAEADHPNSFVYSELLDAFTTLATERGSVVSEDQFSQPYVRMKNDATLLQVWVPQTTAAEGIEDAKADQPTYVRSRIPSVEINKAAWPAFASPDGRSAVRQEIYKRWPRSKLEGPGLGPSLGELAEELLVEASFLESVVELLRDKGQVIFYGPPGTGKTFVARKLMEYLAPERSRREVVQFHPNYSYEDFVHGYRPVTREDGSLTYELKPGPLIRLASQVAGSPGEHVLLIDEINRGNLPKILGELLYLLEYRNDEVVLMYGRDDEDRFSLPKDLLIIGTMNTADRSIALIDAALRRRFHFVPFFPSEPPLDGLLRRWLERHRPEMIEVADVVDKLNTGLRERFGPHLQVGPSYFMRGDLNETVLRRVWDYDVMPFLEDQLFG
jgi:MrcB-like, N-terminal domain/AAA domain (dynein-related subfamily)